MDTSHIHIVGAVTKLSAGLPFQWMQVVASALKSSPTWSSAKTRLVHDVPHLHYRSLAADFIDDCACSAGSVSTEAVALAVLTAAQAEKARRDAQSVELVWTGPDAEAVPFRRTQQAVLQVLNSAQNRLTLVSYAVYNIPHVQNALVQAAGRGVEIKVIVETPDKSQGEDEYNNLLALGGDVASCSTLFYWPHDQRQLSDGGATSKLHAKCAVADGRQLFLSSANLTEYAFTIHMELGLLITGGGLPKQIEEHFDRLISSRVLVKV